MNLSKRNELKKEKRLLTLLMKHSRTAHSRAGCAMNEEIQSTKPILRVRKGKPKKPRRGPHPHNTLIVWGTSAKVQTAEKSKIFRNRTVKKGHKNEKEVQNRRPQHSKLLQKEVSSATCIGKEKEGTTRRRPTKTEQLGKKKGTVNKKKKRGKKEGNGLLEEDGRRRNGSSNNESLQSRIPPEAKRRAGGRFWRTSARTHLNKPARNGQREIAVRGKSKNLNE